MERNPPTTGLATVYSAETLDDLMRLGVESLLDAGMPIHPSKGRATELQAVSLELLNPRARLSRTERRGRLISTLGELSWYLAGANDTDFISYYIDSYQQYDEGGHIHGAYGPRIFGTGTAKPLQDALDNLSTNPCSRKAVIQIFVSDDVASSHKHVPCTCTLQFLLREGRLHLIAYMRSSDVHLGFPHDVFTFTMIQELAARSLGVELGCYVHVAGSFHFYEHTREALEEFLSEGWQSTTQMPPMPTGDPWRAVEAFQEHERNLRLGNDPTIPVPQISPYWQDLCRALQAYALYRARRLDDLQLLRSSLNSPEVFGLYVDEKIAQLFD